MGKCLEEWIQFAAMRGCLDRPKKNHCLFAGHPKYNNTPCGICVWITPCDENLQDLGESQKKQAFQPWINQENTTISTQSWAGLRIFPHQTFPTFRPARCPVDIEGTQSDSLGHQSSRPRHQLSAPRKGAPNLALLRFFVATLVTSKARSGKCDVGTNIWMDKDGRR